MDAIADRQLDEAWQWVSPLVRRSSPGAGTVGVENTLSLQGRSAASLNLRSYELIM